MENLSNCTFRGSARAGDREPVIMLRPSAIMTLRCETYPPTTLPAVHPERRDRFRLGQYSPFLFKWVNIAFLGTRRYKVWLEIFTIATALRADMPDGDRSAARQAEHRPHISYQR